MNFLSWLAVITVLDIFAVLLARLFVAKGKEVYRIGSLVFFGFSAAVFVQLMEYESTAVVNLLWVSLSTIFIAIACYFFFGEKINRWQGLGMLLILGGMAFL